MKKGFFNGIGRSLLLLLVAQCLAVTSWAINFGTLPKADLSAFVSPNTGNLKWFILDVKGFAVEYQSDGQLLNASHSKITGTDAQLWAITGTSDGGYTLYNKTAGNTKMVTFSSDGPKVIVKAEAQDSEKFYAYKSTFADQNGYYFVPKGSNKSLNQQGGKVKYWNNNADFGSTFVLTTIKEKAQQYLNTKDCVGSYTATQLTALQTAVTSGNEEQIETALKALTDQSPISIDNNKIYTLVNYQHPSKPLRATSTERLGLNEESLSDQDMRQMFALVADGNYRTIYNYGVDKTLANNNNSNTEFGFGTSGIRFRMEISSQAGYYYLYTESGNANSYMGIYDNQLKANPAKEESKWRIKELSVSNIEDLNAFKGKVSTINSCRQYPNCVGSYTSGDLAELPELASNLTEYKTKYDALQKIAINTGKTYCIRNKREAASPYVTVEGTTLKHRSKNSEDSQAFCFIPSETNSYKIMNVSNKQYAGIVRKNTDVQLDATGVEYLVDVQATGTPYAIISTKEKPSTAPDHNCWNAASGNRVLGWSGGTDEGSQWFIELNEDLDHVLIDDLKYVSYSSATKREIPAELTAYKAKKTNETSVRLTEIAESGTKILPENMGVILKSETAGSFFLRKSTSTSTITNTDNDLVAATKATPQTGSVFVLTGKGGTIMFNSTVDGTTIPAGKAYIARTTGGTQSLSVTFDSITGIDNAAPTEENVGKVYDLTGRTIAKPAKGLYIAGGKKVFFQ